MHSTNAIHTVSARSLRKFGVVVGGGLLGIGAYVYFEKNISWGAPFFVIGIILIVLGMLRPMALARVERVWMSGSLAMGWVMTRIILTVVYFLIMSPIALFLYITKKRPLLMKPERIRATYWIAREGLKNKKRYYERQF